MYERNENPIFIGPIRKSSIHQNENSWKLTKSGPKRDRCEPSNKSYVFLNDFVSLVINYLFARTYLWFLLQGQSPWWATKYETCHLIKVIYPKYSEHWLSTMAHTIDCVCSKILNHGLNHGLLFSLCKIFWMKKHSKLTWKFRIKI